MKRTFALSAALVLAFAIGSCSSDNGKAPTDPAGAIVDVQMGNDALAAGDYAAANQHYKNALAKDPSNSEANFGAALTELVLASENPDVVSLANLVDLVELPPGFPARAPGNERVGLTRAGETLRHFGIGGVSANPVKYGRAVGKLLLLGAGEPEVLSDVQTIIKLHVLPPLQYAETRLQTLETNANFVFKITPEMSGASDTLEIDLGEIYVLDGVINAIQGWLHMLVAYNFDVYGNPPADSLLAAGTSFGKLHPGGAVDMASAHANLLLSHARIEQMIAYVGAETDPQDDDIIPLAVLSEPDFLEFKAGFDDVKDALTEVVVLDVFDYQNNPVQVAVQIGNFLTNPISDWKTKLPTHTFSPDGRDVFVTDPITFPDPIFNGVFPEMTNSLWQQLIGPVGPVM